MESAYLLKELLRGSEFPALLIRQRKRERFASLSRPDRKLVDDKDSRNTKRATKLAVRIFKDYLTEKNIPHPEKVLLRQSKQEKQIEILIRRVT